MALCGQLSTVVASCATYSTIVASGISYFSVVASEACYFTVWPSVASLSRVVASGSSSSLLCHAYTFHSSIVVAYLASYPHSSGFWSLEDRNAVASLPNRNPTKCDRHSQVNENYMPYALNGMLPKAELPIKRPMNTGAVV